MKINIKKIFFIIISLILITRTIFGGTVQRYYNYDNTSQVTSNNLNGNIDNIITVVNGGLDNDNADTQNGLRFLEILSTLPVAGNEGRLVFDKSDDTLHYDNGSAWASFVTAGVNFDLSNLASPVKINTTLISDTDSTDNLGEANLKWAKLYVDDAYITNTASPNIVDTQFIEYGNGTSVTIRDNLVVNGTITSGVISGYVDGSGTATKIPKWSDSNTLTDSVMTESSSAIEVTGNITATGTASPAIVDTQYIEYSDGGALTVRDNLVVDGTISSGGVNYISGAGTSQYISKFNGTTSLTNSVIQESNSQIGIGISPSYTLHVSGEIYNTGTSSPAIVDTQYLEYSGGGAVIVRDSLTVDKTLTASNLSGTNTGDQNLWATISSQSGSTTANSITDTLTINGGGISTTAISGDTLTITSTEAQTLDSVTTLGSTTTNVIQTGDIDINDTTPHLKLEDSTGSEDDYELYADGNRVVLQNIDDSQDLISFDASNNGTIHKNLTVGGSITGGLLTATNATVNNNLTVQGQTVVFNGATDDDVLKYDSATSTWRGEAAAGGGTISGSGTNGTISKFTSSTAIGDSIITESGTDITVAGDVTLSDTTPHLRFTDTTGGDNDFEIYADSDRLIFVDIDNLWDLMSFDSSGNATIHKDLTIGGSIKGGANFGDGSSGNIILNFNSSGSDGTITWDGTENAFTISGDRSNAGQAAGLNPTQSADQAITGVGFKPRMLWIICNKEGAPSRHSFGFTDGINEVCMYKDGTNYSSLPELAINIETPSSVELHGRLKSFDSDGFTIEWTETGAFGGFVYFNWMALK